MAHETPGATANDRELLRFITCGSVDDGKSTLLGRLLYEAKLIFEDQLAAVARDSRKYGTQGDKIDLALLLEAKSLRKKVAPRLILNLRKARRRETGRRNKTSLNWKQQSRSAKAKLPKGRSRHSTLK